MATTIEDTPACVVHFSSLSAHQEPLQTLNPTKRDRIISFSNEWINGGKEPELAVAKRLLSELGNCDLTAAHNAATNCSAAGIKVNRAIVETNRKRKVS